MNKCKDCKFLSKSGWCYITRWPSHHLKDDVACGDFEPKEKTFYWVCPRCGADFYHPSFIEFHYKIAHPGVKVTIVSRR